MSRQGFESYLLGGAMLCLAFALFTIFRARSGKVSWMLPLSWVFMGGLLLALRGAEAVGATVYIFAFLAVACLVGDIFMRASRRAG